MKKEIYCKTCGFPKDMIRNPVILESDVFSLIHYEDNTCEECGHQKDGSTIKLLQPYFKEVYNLGYNKAIEDVEKMIDEYTRDKEEFYNLCISLEQINYIKNKLKQKLKEKKEQ